MSANSEWERLAAELANLPDVIDQLQAKHQADGMGLCKSCTSPGTGTRRVPWPCSIASLAAHAKQLR